jgi:hypothetical protein
MKVFRKRYNICENAKNRPTYAKIYPLRAVPVTPFTQYEGVIATRNIKAKGVSKNGEEEEK